jgi:HemY protein
MAEIEQGERHDAAAAHSWLSRAVRAPRDADWRCGNCGWSTPDWHAVCANCGAFDTLAWSAPATDTLEMMPGAAHDERLGMDSTPSSFLQAPGEIGENADLVPSRTPWRKDGNALGDGDRGFVILSRPPDDPGPGGDEFDPEPAVSRGGSL